MINSSSQLKSHQKELFALSQETTARAINLSDVMSSFFASTTRASVIVDVIKHVVSMTSFP